MAEKVEKAVVSGAPDRSPPPSRAGTLPISVILPTRNSAALLPHHLAAMRSWVDSVQEVVVVDSGSTDGTVELLRTGLRHPEVRFLQHPPGLYQSWNFGIQQARAEACYISTVGETIEVEGLKHMSLLLSETRSDVVVSKPGFVDLTGRPIASTQWPVDDVLRTLRPREPVVLEGAALFFFTLLNYRNAMLGSSASDLYRTRTLQQRPFPVDYGTVGDGAWTLENCFGVRITVTPRRFSTFREHPKSYARSEYAVDGLSSKLLGLIERTYRLQLRTEPSFSTTADELRIEQLMGLLHEHLNAQQDLEAARATTWPWVLRPTAWAARMRRNAVTRRIAPLKKAGVSHLFCDVM